LTVARKAKGAESWFLRAITDENPKKSEIKLDFLLKGKNTKQQSIYEDAKDADWKNNPIAYKIIATVVTSKSKLI
jgi:hypothetical protein